MKQSLKTVTGNLIFGTITGVLLLMFGVLIGRGSIRSEVVNSYFTPHSNEFLEGARLDLPEEISTITQQTDTTIDLLLGYYNVEDNVIYLEFTGKHIMRDNYMFVTEHSQLLPDEHYYQLDLTEDSVYLWHNNKFLGRAKNGCADSLLRVVNQ